MDNYVVFKKLEKPPKLYLGKVRYKTTEQVAVNNIFNNIVSKKIDHINKTDVIDDMVLQQEFPDIKSVFDTIGSLTDEFEEQSTRIQKHFEKLKQEYEDEKLKFTKSHTLVLRKYGEDVRQIEQELHNEAERINKDKERILINSDKHNTFHQNDYVAFIQNGKLCVGKVIDPNSSDRKVLIEGLKNKTMTYFIPQNEVQSINKVKNDGIKGILKTLLLIRTTMRTEIENLSIPFGQLKSDFEDTEKQFASANNELSKKYNEELRILESKLEGEIEIENKIREKEVDQNESIRQFYTNRKRSTRKGNPDVRSVFTFKSSKKSPQSKGSKKSPQSKGGKKKTKKIR